MCFVCQQKGFAVKFTWICCLKYVSQHSWADIEFVLDICFEAQQTFNAQFFAIFIEKYCKGIFCRHFDTFRNLCFIYFSIPLFYFHILNFDLNSILTYLTFHFHFFALFLSLFTFHWSLYASYILLHFCSLLSPTLIPCSAELFNASQTLTLSKSFTSPLTVIRCDSLLFLFS